MRNVSVVAVAAALVGCGGSTSLQPVSLSAPAPESTAVTMECVTRELDNLGFETSDQSEPNSVTGVRINRQPWFLRWLYRDTADQIMATVEGGQLRVTAISSDPNELGEEGPPRSGASATATRNAESILATCS